MHIAFLTPEYPHAACTVSGGLGTSIKNLAHSLVKKDLEVSLVIYAQKSDRNFEEDGIRFYLIQQKKYKLGGWYFYRKYLQNFLNELSKVQHIDIIEGADWTGITAFMQLNFPLIIRLHGSDTYFCALEQRKQKLKNRWFEEKALKNADHLVSVSGFTGNKTVSLFNLKKDFTVIPNGIDIEDFRPFGGNAQPNQLFYFGTLIRKKGILELAEIFNVIISKKPDIQLIVAGRDVIDIKENESTLKLFKSRLNERAQHNFTYLGEVAYQKIKNVLSNSAVVVLPSFAEALPMTWLEAMAMEKPLVTSNIGWAKEVMVNGETGFTENPKDHKAYAEKILYLLDNPCEAAEMGKAARGRVKKKFSTEVVVDQNIKFYNSVLKLASN